MAVTITHAPNAFNFSKNFIPVKFQSDTYLDITGELKDNYFIYLEIWMENKENTVFELVFTQNIPLQASQPGMAVTDLASIINSKLEADGPDYMGVTEGFALLKKSARKFYLKYAENTDATVGEKTTSETYTVAYGGLSYTASFANDMLSLLRPGGVNQNQDRFLRQGNATQYTRSNQPQFLYFLNTRVDRNISLKTIFTFTDGSSITKTSDPVSLPTGRKIGFNLKFDAAITDAEINGRICKSYRVNLVDGATDVSETRTFLLDYSIKEYVRYFIYWSCWGALNTLVTYGKWQSEINISQTEASRVRKAGDDIKLGDRLNFDLSINSSYKCATGFMQRREIGLNRDFYLSPLKFRYTGGNMLPVSVTSKTITEIQDGNNLYAQSFEYNYLFDDDCYTELNEEDGIGLDTFFFDLNPIIPQGTFQESDPTVPFWVKAITQADIVKWNTDLVGVAGKALRADVADYALNSNKWAGRFFTEYLDQPVRTTDAVKFASVIADGIGSSAYVSGFTGSGFRIDADGNAEFDNLSVRKELNINVLNVREITGSGGSVAITNVAKIKTVTDEAEVWHCEINTDDDTIAVQLRVNDLVRCQIWDGKRLKYYNTKVVAVSTGSFDLSKTDKVGGGIPEAGDTVFQFGNTTDTSRQGLLYLTNSDSGAPYLDVLDGINSESLVGKTKVRLGKLDGITDPALGQLDGYGLYADRVFIKGKIVVTGGNAQTRDGSQAQIDAIKLGGRNLLLNSGIINATDPVVTQWVFGNNLPIILS